jgi:hypothetical protein
MNFASIVMQFILVEKRVRKSKAHSELDLSGILI